MFHSISLFYGQIINIYIFLLVFFVNFNDIYENKNIYVKLVFKHIIKNIHFFIYTIHKRSQSL
jgi:hypothetical protein